MTTVSALQDWLSLEHQAVWLYPAIGGRLVSLAPRARVAYDAHRAVRDNLLTRIERAGGEPVGTALAYDVGPLDTAARARAAARGVESALAASCLTLVGVTVGDDRRWAVAGVRRAALAGLAWGDDPRAFPGLP